VQTRIRRIMERPLESFQAYGMDECCKEGNCPVCNPPLPEDETGPMTGYKLTCPNCGYSFYECPDLANAEVVGLYEASHEGYCLNCGDGEEEKTRFERTGPYTLTVRS
jgi:hypothetical protein